MERLTVVTEKIWGMVVDIRDFELIQLDDCKNINKVIILNKEIIVPKEYQVGNKYLFFPEKICLSDSYIWSNNLYKASHNNKDYSTRGIMPFSGKVVNRVINGHNSEGLLLPVNTLAWCGGGDGRNFKFLSPGETFNWYRNYYICGPSQTPTKYPGPSSYEDYY